MATSQVTIEMKPNEVYGVSADDIETTSNEVYNVRQVSQHPQEPSYYDSKGFSDPHTYEDVR